MIIKKLREQKNTKAIQNFVFNYLPTIGFEQFSNFIESDSKTFTIRFKNHQKMQLIFSENKSDSFSFFLCLLNDGVNYEYISFSFDNGNIVPKEYVIRHNFHDQECDLEQTFDFQQHQIELKSCFHCKIDKLSVECSNFDFLRTEIANFLPMSDDIYCMTKQIIAEPVLESHFGATIMHNIICKTF